MHGIGGYPDRRQTQDDQACHYPGQYEHLPALARHGRLQAERRQYDQGILEHAEQARTKRSDEFAGRAVPRRQLQGQGQSQHREGKRPETEKRLAIDAHIDQLQDEREPDGDAHLDPQQGYKDIRHRTPSLQRPVYNAAPERS